MSVFSSLWHKQLLSVTAICLIAVSSVFAAPTKGGGINASDTWVTMNITVQETMSANLPNAMWSVSAGRFVTTAQYSLAPRHFYVEAGFDTGNLLVINIQPTDAPTDPTTTLYSGVGKITVHGDRLFLYDASNNPIPVVMPDNAPIPVLSVLGLTPGPSVLKGIITTSPPAMAAAIPGTLSYPQSNLAQILSQSGSSRSKTLTYAQSGSNWILQTVVHTMSSTSHNMTTTSQVANVVWNDNSTGDAQRATKASSLVPYKSAGTLTVNSASVPGPTTITPSVQTTTGATGANVIFQHGILSSGQAWNRMAPWLEADFNFKNVLIPSLNSTDSLSNQTSALTSLVQSSGVSNNLVIGHSQGGLIARNAAQNNSSLFYGVAELDSPNTGALILNNGMQDIGNALVDEFDNLLYDAGCYSPYDSPWCWIGFFGGDYGIPVAVDYGFNATIPATTDLKIGSSYLNNLNSTTEHFPRVGISGHADKRWVFFRLTGDAFCYPDDDTCGGRVVADYAEYAYDTLWGVWAYYTLLCDPSQYDCQGGADQAMAVINDMDNFDSFYNDLTAGSDSSDAIVQGASQYYTNATQNYIISGADSHIGAHNSPLDRAVLDQALSQQFFTPPSGCSFTASASPTSFPFYGGQIAITVTGSPSNATTCTASAVSNVVWMEAWGSPYITYTTRSPITLTWLVDINLGQDTRTGTLTVGGNTITVTQSGVLGTVSTGSVALSGAIPPRFQLCASGFSCPSEAIAIVVNGITVSTAGTTGYFVPSHIIGWKGPTDDNLNVVSSLIAATINGDASSPVYSGIVGPVVYLVSKNTGGANYSYSASAGPSKNPTTCLVSVTTAGPTMTGSQ